VVLKLAIYIKYTHKHMHMCIDCFFFKAFLPTSRKRLPDRGRWGTTTHCLGMRKLRKGRSKGQRMEMYMYEYLYIIYGYIDIYVYDRLCLKCVYAYVYVCVCRYIYCNDFICWLSCRMVLIWTCLSLLFYVQKKTCIKEESNQLSIGHHTQRQWKMLSFSTA